MANQDKIFYRTRTIEIEIDGVPTMFQNNETRLIENFTLKTEENENNDQFLTIEELLDQNGKYKYSMLEDAELANDIRNGSHIKFNESGVPTHDVDKNTEQTERERLAELVFELTLEVVDKWAVDKKNGGGDKYNEYEALRAKHPAQKPEKPVKPKPENKKT